MSEQIKAEDNVGTPIAGEAPQYSETERTAMEQGWMPLEKWTEAGRDPSEHRTAREFKDRGDLLKRIQDQNKYIQGMNASFENLRQHNQRTYESAYKKAIADLKAAHTAAVNDGDIAKADQLVDQISDEKTNFLKAQANMAAAQQTTTQESLEMREWKNANKWYTEDEDLKLQADAFGFRYVQANQGKVTPEQVLEHVSKKMAKYLPQQGQGDIIDDEPAPKRYTAPNPVGGGRASARPAAGSAAGLREGELSDDESKAMKDFVKYGLGTKAEYLKQLKEVRG